MSVNPIAAQELYPVLATMLPEMGDPEAASMVNQEVTAFLAENARAFRDWYGRDYPTGPVDWMAVLELAAAGGSPRWADVPGLAYNLPPDASELARAFVARATRVTGGQVR